MQISEIEIYVNKVIEMYRKENFELKKRIEKIELQIKELNIHVKNIDHRTVGLK